MDLATGTPVEGAREQTRMIFDYLQEILTAAGLSLESIVKTTCYLTNLERDYDAFNDVYKTYIDGATRTTVQVAALGLGSVVEIEAVARLS